MSSPTPPYRRRSLRLQGFDYSQDGAYFVTICTAGRRCLFGDVVGGELRLSAIGEMAQQHWEDPPIHHTGVELDAFVVMPNHVHGIIIFAANDRGADDHPVREGEAGLATTGDGGVASGRRKRTLGVVVAGFKSAVSREVRASKMAVGASLWQAGYYEHVVRSESALDRIREYIENNPAKWAYDHDNPANWRAT